MNELTVHSLLPARPTLVSMLSRVLYNIILLGHGTQEVAMAVDRYSDQ